MADAPLIEEDKNLLKDLSGIKSQSVLANIVRLVSQNNSKIFGYYLYVKKSYNQVQ